MQKGRENVCVEVCIYIHKNAHMSEQLMHVLLRGVKLEHVKSVLAESRAS